MALSYITTNFLKCVLKEHIEIEVLYFLNILFKLKLLCFHNMCIFFPISLSVKQTNKKTEFAVYVPNSVVSFKGFPGVNCGTMCKPAL